MTTLLDQHLDQLVAAVPHLRRYGGRLARWGHQLAWTLGTGGRLLVAGNGGSAEQAQHLAAELVGRLGPDRPERPPLAAVALGAEPVGLTALANDYGYDQAYARQVRAHGRPGDVLLLLSTSGRSPNLLAAAAAGAEAGLRCWALTGPAPNPLAADCAQALAIPADAPQVVQELHLVAVHVLCEQVEHALPGVPRPAEAASADRPGQLIRPEELAGADVTDTADLSAPGDPTRDPADASAAAAPIVRERP